MTARKPAWKNKGQRSQKAEAGVWFPIGAKQHKDFCCDCGLAHISEYRVVQFPDGTFGVQQRAWRDERSTAAKRRQKRLRKEAFPK